MTKNKKKTAQQMRQHPWAANDGETFVEHLTIIIISHFVNNLDSCRGERNE